MRNYYVVLFLGFFLSLFWGNVQAQDPPFSQIINAPVLLNPALTGVMNNDARMYANYRTQWASVATPFETMSFVVDFSPLKYIFNTDDMLGIGAYFLRDQAGSTGFNNTQFHLSTAYSKSLTGEGNNYLSIGGQVGYATQSLDIEKLTFDSQIEGGVLDPNLGSGEDDIFGQSGYWDVSAGISWTYTPEKSQNYFIGASIHHLNEPKVSFMNDETALLYRRYTVYAGSEFRLNYLISLMPRAFYMQQGTAQQFTAGSLVKFNVETQRNRYDSSAFMLGMLYRVQDALIFVARYDFKSLGISFSYDINTSNPLNSYSNGYGAMEVAVSYRTDLSNKRRYSRGISSPNF